MTSESPYQRLSNTSGNDVLVPVTVTRARALERPRSEHKMKIDEASFTIYGLVTTSKQKQNDATEAGAEASGNALAAPLLLSSAVGGGAANKISKFTGAATSTDTLITMDSIHSVKSVGPRAMSMHAKTCDGDLFLETV